MSILKDFKFHSPDSLSQALELLDKTRAPLLLAGGTFALNTLKKSSKYPSDVISLKKIPELKGIKVKGKELWIGSMTCIDELIGSKLTGDTFPSLKDAALKLGTTPIRNMATIGGNIASRFYWVDLSAVLISLGARVEAASLEEKRIVDLDKFLAEKSSKKVIITGILLPQEERCSYYFRHTRSVQEIDVPTLGLAFSCIKGKEGLSDVRAVVNTTLSFPVILKGIVSILKNSEYKNVKVSDIREAILKDAESTKLDEHRLALLVQDLEKLIELLKAV